MQFILITVEPGISAYLTGQCPKVFEDFGGRKVAIFGQIWSNFAVNEDILPQILVL